MFYALKTQIDPNRPLGKSSHQQLRAIIAEQMNTPQLAKNSEYADQDSCAYAGKLLDRPVVLLNQDGFIMCYQDDNIIFPSDNKIECQKNEIDKITATLKLKNPLYFYYIDNHYMGAKPKTILK